MAVVINEFEVVPAPPTPPPAAGKDRPAERGSAREPELDRVLELKRERASRVRAH